MPQTCADCGTTWSRFFVTNEYVVHGRRVVRTTCLSCEVAYVKHCQETPPGTPTLPRATARKAAKR